MGTLEAMLLGLIQGLTEFLPVSSSGHLALAEAVINVPGPRLAFNVLLHGGTLIAVLLYYFKDIILIFKELPTLLRGIFRRESAGSLRDTCPHGWMGLMVVVSTIPTGLLAILAKDFMESLFQSPLTVGLMLVLTGLILLSTLWTISKKDPGGQDVPLTLPKALLLGLAQGLAITPGISRSGTTISTALHMGLSPELSTRFSFLLAVPAIGGALFLEGRHLTSLPSGQALPYLAGTLVALVTGLASLKLLTLLVLKARFHIFAFYCIPLGLAAVLFSLLS